MARPKDYSFRYRAPIERRKVKAMPMGRGGWLPPGEKKPAPVKRFTAKEIAEWMATQKRKA